jgi:hypothetical protein
MSTAPKHSNILSSDVIPIELDTWTIERKKVIKHVPDGHTLVVTRSNRRGAANWLLNKACRTQEDFGRYVFSPQIYAYRFWHISTALCADIRNCLPAGSQQIRGDNFTNLHKQLPPVVKGIKRPRLVLVMSHQGIWCSSHLLNGSYVLDRHRPGKGYQVSFWIVPQEELETIQYTVEIPKKKKIVA